MLVLRILRLSHFRIGAIVLACAMLSCESSVTAHLLPGGESDVAAADAATDAACGDEESCGARTALYFKGPYDRVEIPSSPLLDVPQEFAVEAWVFAISYAGGHGIINRWAPTIADVQLTFGSPEILPLEEFSTSELIPSHALASWVFIRPSKWVTVTASAQPSVQTWHHIAMSYGGGALKLYVDGIQVGSALGNEPAANADSKLYIGATARTERVLEPTRGTYWWPPLDGYIAEVRLSTSDRYKVNFIPERKLASDATTLALWHLDEGSGNVARDSGPNQLHGAVIGPTWTTPPK